VSHLYWHRGGEENYKEFLLYRKELKILAEKFPAKKPLVVTPFYSRGA
jgi:hypothetical protein